MWGRPGRAPGDTNITHLKAQRSWGLHATTVRHTEKSASQQARASKPLTLNSETYCHSYYS